MHKRIRLIREYLKMTLQEFSEEINIDYDILRKTEKGELDLDESSIQRICSKFSVNEIWLRSGIGYKGDLFKINDLSNIKHHLYKILISIEDFLNTDMNIDINSNNNLKNINDDIEQTIMSYRLELEAEKKGAIL